MYYGCYTVGKNDTHYSCTHLLLTFVLKLPLCQTCIKLLHNSMHQSVLIELICGGNNFLTIIILSSPFLTLILLQLVRFSIIDTCKLYIKFLYTNNIHFPLLM